MGLGKGDLVMRLSTRPRGIAPGRRGGDSSFVSPALAQRLRWSVGSGLLILTIAALGSGCGTTKVSGTSRTATEQILLTNAWDDALSRVDFRPLTGVPVFLDSQFMDASLDKGWLISSVRQAMLAQGVLLRAKPEQAQWIVEPRVGTYGTNDHSWLFGVQQTTIPSFLGSAGGTIPEVPVAKKSVQQGVVKLALYAYDRGSGQVTWTSGTMLATTDAKDVYIGGIGPIQSGSIRTGTQFVGVQLPSLGIESEEQKPLVEPRSDVPFHAPSQAVPIMGPEIDQFAP